MMQKQAVGGHSYSHSSVNTSHRNPHILAAEIYNMCLSGNRVIFDRASLGMTSCRLLFKVYAQ